MINSELIHTLSLLMILTSFAAVELGRVRHCIVAYCVQALLICGLLAAYSVQNEALLYWAGVALVTKAILVPWMLWRSSSGEEHQTHSVVEFKLSAILLAIFLVAMFKLMNAHADVFISNPDKVIELAETNLAVAFSVFALGLYAILTRRDVIESVIGLCLLENGVHLSLVSLAPMIKETALVGIATEVVVTVYLLLYIIGGIREKIGTSDTFKLSELHW